MTHFLNFESAGGRVWKVDHCSSNKGFFLTLFANFSKYNMLQHKGRMLKVTEMVNLQSKHVSAIQEYLSHRQG